MYNVQTINLDISLRDPTPRVVAKQGDAGSRKIMIKLYDNGIPANINNQIAPSGTEQKGVVRFCKPDGTGGIYDKTEDNLPACILGGDNITVRLAEQMLTRPGDVVADVAIICGNTVISTFNFVVHVQATPAAGVTASNNYYNYQSLADINQAIDDAKAAAAGAVKSINGSKPDSNGNVNVVAGVAKVNGKTGNVSIAANAYTTCSTAAGTAAKVAEFVDGFAPVIGAVLAVRFTNSNTAESPRLNYDGIEYIIRDRITAQPIKPSDITAGLYRFMLISGAWILLDKLPSEGTTTPVPGDPGEDGGYWIPAVDEAGNLTWAASKDGMGEAPAAANILGSPGKNGGYYIPKVSQPGSNVVQIAFDPSEPGMTSVQPRQIVLPKGDPGQDGVSPTISITTITGGHRLTITDAEGPKSADILDGATPALQIGTVTTLPAGSPATAEITGTAANPVLSFGLPRGADATGGSAGVTTINGLDGAVKLPVSGSCICNSNAADKRKVLTGVTAGFDPSADGAILAVQFKSPGNTASGPELQIGQTVYTIQHPGNLTPPAASALKKSVHHFSMRGSTRAAILLDPYVAPSTVNVDATLTQSGQAADAKIVGSALATRVPAAPLDSDAGKVATVGSDGIPRWETLPAVGSLFGRCSTAACDAAKKATYIDGSVAGGTIITVEFVNANEAENPTLTANGVTGAIVGRTLAPISATSLTAGVHRFVRLSNYNKWMMLDAPDELEYIGEYTLAEDVATWEITSDLSGAPLQLKKMYFELHIQPAQVNIDNNISNTHARMTVPTWANAYGVNTCVSGYPMLRKTAYKENPGWGQLWEIRTLNGRNVVFRRSKGASCAATVSAGEAAGPGHITGLGLSSLDPTKAQFGAGSTVKIWGAKI